MKLAVIFENNVNNQEAIEEALMTEVKRMSMSVEFFEDPSVSLSDFIANEKLQQVDTILVVGQQKQKKSELLGKAILHVTATEILTQPDKVIAKFLTEETLANQEESQQKLNGRLFYDAIMNGVSYMIPFIVTGGLLIAVSLSLGGTATANGFVFEEGSIWNEIFKIGSASMSLMVPILASYIGHFIGGNAALAPGFVGGFIAVDGSFYGSENNTGFIGGIIAGLLAGLLVRLLSRIKIPEIIAPVMPVIFIPLIATLIVGLVFIYIVGVPVSSFFESLTNWLQSLQGNSKLLLAAIIGLMISVDVGGPFNKTAFLFASGLIAEGNYEIMGVAAVAISIPPLSTGLASILFAKKFDSKEQNAGKATFIMGLFGITEGAIPFVTSDPLHVIPSVVIGSVTGSVIAMLGGVENVVSHGGPIVAILGGISNVLMFAVAVLVGTVISVSLLFLLKKNKLVENEIGNKTIAS
ncbi:PTS fructose transporter subunit IIC [Enterococcus sp. ALS3]|uniref:PTS fructose transporter subunit IIC n=1 Tax=Enterococcus alishanensis TaxID=1303817 RepID=A0ABS6TA21_9ENTE|nr:PTS fructose transporter subunit IIC [Enterococcus alishanensis]